MSKHLGNILEPMPLMERARRRRAALVHGRRRLAVAARRVGHARAPGDRPQDAADLLEHRVVPHALRRRQRLVARRRRGPPVADRPLLDRWALSEAHRLVARGRPRRYEALRHPAGRARCWPTFVDDLSNWYVRRSRRRFWDGDPAALATLHECLYVLTLLMAPLVPFVTERVWQDVVRRSTPDAPDSVHLAVLADGRRRAGRRRRSPTQMALVRRLVELGRAARAESKVSTRQPLGRALVGAAGWAELPDELRAAGRRRAQRRRLRASLGGRPGRRSGQGQLPGAGQAVRQAHPGGRRGGRRGRRGRAGRSAARRRHGDGRRRRRRGRGRRRRGALTETPREGWAVATDGGETVALDLELTPELRRAGLAREVVRLVQEARKTAGLDVTDRIELAGRPTGRPPTPCGSTAATGGRRGAGRRLRRGRAAPPPPAAPRTTPGWVCVRRHPYGAVTRQGTAKVQRPTTLGRGVTANHPFGAVKMAGVPRPILSRRSPTSVTDPGRPGSTGRSRWHCTPCRSAVRPRRAQAEGDAIAVPALASHVRPALVLAERESRELLAAAARTTSAGGRFCGRPRRHPGVGRPLQRPQRHPAPPVTSARSTGATTPPPALRDDLPRHGHPVRRGRRRDDALDPRGCARPRRPSRRRRRITLPTPPARDPFRRLAATGN